MKCPECNAPMTCRDSRPHDFGKVKRRRHCADCDYVTNSLEVLLPAESSGTETAQVAFQLKQTANGSSEAERVAGMLRALADNLDR